jgi:Flp pilus assembly protein CpaB
VSFRTTLQGNEQGVIAPGARIDVSGQSPTEFGQGGMIILAQNALVLTSKEIEAPAGPDKIPVPAPGATTLITVAVSPPEAAALIGSMQRGQLAVMLRAPKD